MILIFIKSSFLIKQFYLKRTSRFNTAINWKNEQWFNVIIHYPNEYWFVFNWTIINLLEWSCNHNSNICTGDVFKTLSASIKTTKNEDRPHMVWSTTFCKNRKFLQSYSVLLLLTCCIFPAQRPYEQSSFGKMKYLGKTLLMPGIQLRMVVYISQIVWYSVF